MSEKTVMVNGKPIKVNVNPKLKTKNKKSSGLAKKIATGALILSIGTGAIFGGHALWNHWHSAQDPKVVSEVQVKENLRFNPNSKESIVDNAVFLIEDAARAGKELDAEDAVLSVVVANSNEITSGFMGELFGETKDQTYTYGQLVDAYLRVGMMNVENIALSNSEDLALNTENIFANQEDFDYLNNVRNLVYRFNNAADENERIAIASELNQIASSLCTYDAYDISSAAGVLSMLSLDGMRLITNTNTSYTVLPNDIRDEMFGDGDYSCRTEATFTSNDGQVLQTQYSYRVNDLKLDSVKTKLNNAVLAEGKTIILPEIIAEVRERTKDVQIADVNAVDAINEAMEENRNILYEYESSKGVAKSNYSPKTASDKVETHNGKQVIVSQDNTSKTPKGQTKAQAEAELQTKVADAQAEANKGANDGKYYGENGLVKPSLSGKSQTYINAFNASYDAYKAVYDAKHSTEPDVVIKEEIIPATNYNTSNNNYTTNNNSYNNNYNNNSSSSNYSSNKNKNNSSKKNNTSSSNSNSYSSSSKGNVVKEETVSLDDLSPEELRQWKEAISNGEGEYSNGRTR